MDLNGLLAYINAPSLVTHGERDRQIDYNDKDDIADWFAEIWKATLYDHSPFQAHRHRP